MVTIGQIHFVLAVASLVLGATVVLAKKGTALHRVFGFAYATTMFGMLGTALLVYNLTGEFGPFHILAVFSLATLVGGVGVALVRRPSDWIAMHAYFMAWSYVGLLAAAAAETLTRLPDAPFWGAVVVASGVVIGVGGFVIARFVPLILRRDFS